MARYNEILTGRHNKFVAKLFGMKGPPPAPQLSSEISVAHPIFHGVENRFLESWDRYAHHTVATAVAANGSAVQLRNPASSNVVAVIEKLTLVNLAGAADIPFLSRGGAADLLGGLIAVGVVNLDNRSRPHGTCFLSTQNTIAGVVADLGTGVIARIPLAIASSVEFLIDELVTDTLLPGDAIRLRSSIVNQAVAWNIIWRERALEESELK